MFSKKAALKLNGNRQPWIYFNEVGGQEIIKSLKIINFVKYFYTESWF